MVIAYDAAKQAIKAEVWKQEIDDYGRCEQSSLARIPDMCTGACDRLGGVGVRGLGKGVKFKGKYSYGVAYGVATGPQ